MCAHGNVLFDTKLPQRLPHGPKIKAQRKIPVVGIPSGKSAISPDGKVTTSSRSQPVLVKTIPSKFTRTL